jgi:hypothetical protein
LADDIELGLSFLLTFGAHAHCQKECLNCRDSLAKRSWSQYLLYGFSKDNTHGVGPSYEVTYSE